MTIHNRRDYEGQKGKSINVNYWWNMGDTSTNIFTLYHVIMVLYIYKYWFKMLKRWKFPPLIKARASIALWVISHVLATQHTYIQSMLNLARFISFLPYKSLINVNFRFPTLLISAKNMNLLPSSTYKHLQTNLIKQTIFDTLGVWKSAYFCAQ